MRDTFMAANLANRYQFLLSHGRTPPGQCDDAPDLQWAYSGRPALNLVCAARLDAGVDGRIAAVLARYRAWHTPFFWLTDPLTRPVDLPQRLLASGFYCDDELTCMALDLQAWRRDAAEEVDLSIAAVTPGPSACDWARTACLGFAIPEPHLSHHVAILAELAAEPLPYRRYLGCHGARPVATLCTFTTGDVAGIYWVSTLPEARGRGYATALMLRALGDAQAAGTRLAILQSSREGHGLYRRLGFEDCGVEVAYGYPIS